MIPPQHKGAYKLKWSSGFTQEPWFFSYPIVHSFGAHAVCWRAWHFCGTWLRASILLPIPQITINPHPVQRMDFSCMENWVWEISLWGYKWPGLDSSHICRVEITDLAYLTYQLEWVLSHNTLEFVAHWKLQTANSTAEDTLTHWVPRNLVCIVNLVLTFSRSVMHDKSIMASLSQSKQKKCTVCDAHSACIRIWTTNEYLQTFFLMWTYMMSKMYSPCNQLSYKFSF